MHNPVFSFWDFSETIPESAVAFGASAPEDSPSATWHLDLPLDQQAASQVLEAYSYQAQASVQIIEDLPERIDNLVTRVQAANASGVSFSTIEQSDLPLEEADLLDSLFEIDRMETQVSFGLEEKLPKDWQAPYQQFQSTAARVLRSISHLAWVETSQAGRLIGRTSVGWAGDMETMYAIALLPQQLDLHRHSLEIALVARHALIRAFTATVATASRLSLLLATPGGALLSLPAVWKYVNQMLSEVEKYKAVTAR